VKKALRAFFKTLEREFENEGDTTEKANSIRLIKTSRERHTELLRQITDTSRRERRDLFSRQGGLNGII
jgi:hypothetical protein